MTAPFFFWDAVPISLRGYPSGRLVLRLWEKRDFIHSSHGEEFMSFFAWVLAYGSETL